RQKDRPGSGQKGNAGPNQERGSSSNQKSAKAGGKREGGGPAKKDDDRDALDAGAQEPLVREFLEGLLAALGLEGSVDSRVEEDVIVVDVRGEQTEALVGQRGTVMEAVHELTKTVLQRSAKDAARVRIDIAGYAERRRQALTIYAGELIDQILEEGGELMLEPMSASDRKVIHDAVADRSGVRSYSEGEAPQRYVVIATTEEESPQEEEGESPQEDEEN
ncbi:MAG: protein jag, partial [Actinomycetota bacterium]